MRPPISEPFHTGIKAIDGFLTMGKGQRVGLFAGGGVGKSTLLGQITRQSKSDVNIVALVGERSREVQPFIEQSLGEEGLKKSVVVVSTGDDVPLKRIRAAESALQLAEWFRDRGKDVLLMIDSVTRLAYAQRELSTYLNEPPSARGYPPSTFQMLPRLMERMGVGPRGSITGIVTVLVDGDDMNEPVADCMRATLDGHFILDRKLAHRGHFPAINVLDSVSRVFLEITPQAHRTTAMALRDSMTEYTQIKDLLQIGAYKPGTQPATDAAIRRQPIIDGFLKQGVDEFAHPEQTIQQMQHIAGF